MSMLSAQRDRLHLQAELLESHGRFVGFEGAVSMDPLMVGAAQEMRHAADTIWSLRNKLNDAIDERDDAREERDSYRASLQEAEHEESLAWDRVRKAETESAKLLKICEDMLRCITVNHDCQDCVINGEQCSVTTLDSRMREKARCE